MKKTLLILILIITFRAFGQPGTEKLKTETPKLIDSAMNAVKGKDTVGVPVYISERVDTNKVETLVYKGTDGNVKWCSPGYVIVKVKIASRDEKNYYPIDQGKLIGALDDKKRPVKPIAQ